MEIIIFAIERLVESFIPFALMLVAGWARSKPLTIVLVAFLVMIMMGFALAPDPNVQGIVEYLIVGGLGFALARLIRSRSKRGVNSDPGLASSPARHSVSSITPPVLQSLVTRNVLRNGTLAISLIAAGAMVGVVAERERIFGYRSTDDCIMREARHAGANARLLSHIIVSFCRKEANSPDGLSDSSQQNQSGEPNRLLEEWDAQQARKPSQH